MTANNIDFQKECVNLNYDTLFFEITRKCNLKCKHCFRGDAQNVSMNKEIIDKTLDQVGYCYHFVMTGGEPFLEPEIINYLIDGIIKRKLRFLGFSVVVNGTILDERAIQSIIAMNKLATYYYEELLPLAYKTQKGKKYSFDKDYGKHPEKEKPISISISVDEFHNNDVNKAITFYKKYANNKYIDVKGQDTWTKTQEDGSILTQTEAHKVLSENGKTWVDNEGRAKQNGIGYKRNACEHCANNCHRILIEDNQVKCGIQICANGNVSLSGQLSFEHLDKYTMGNILNRPISCMIVDWQWNEPLECKEIDDMLQLKTMLEYEKYTENIPKLSEDAKESLKWCVNLMLLKRETLKKAHEMLPYLPYEDLTNAVDADLNISTSGKYAQYMRLYYDRYKEKYPKDWNYNSTTEQMICNKYKRINKMLAVENGDLQYGKFGVLDTILTMFGV